MDLAGYLEGLSDKPNGGKKIYRSIFVKVYHNEYMIHRYVVNSYGEDDYKDILGEVNRLGRDINLSISYIDWDSYEICD